MNYNTMCRQIYYLAYVHAHYILWPDSALVYYYELLARVHNNRGYELLVLLYRTKCGEFGKATVTHHYFTQPNSEIHQGS